LEFRRVLFRSAPRSTRWARPSPYARREASRTLHGRRPLVADRQPLTPAAWKSSPPSRHFSLSKRAGHDTRLAPDPLSRSLNMRSPSRTYRRSKCVTAETSCCHDPTEDAFLYTHKAIWLYTPRPQDNSADKPVILGKA